MVLTHAQKMSIQQSLRLIVDIGNKIARTKEGGFEQFVDDLQKLFSVLDYVFNQTDPPEANCKHGMPHSVSCLLCGEDEDPEPEKKTGETDDILEHTINALEQPPFIVIERNESGWQKTAFNRFAVECIHQNVSGDVLISVHEVLYGVKASFSDTVAALGGGQTLNEALNGDVQPNA